MDRDQIRSYIIEKANKTQEDLKNDLKNKFVFLKFDCATRIRTNYLGVNVRYVSNGYWTTRTLAVLDTESQHTAAELRKLLMKVLDNYEIPLDHILTGVTDNASNMVKLMDEMNKVSIN